MRESRKQYSNGSWIAATLLSAALTGCGGGEDAPESSAPSALAAPVQTPVAAPVEAPAGTPVQMPVSPPAGTPVQTPVAAPVPKPDNGLALTCEVCLPSEALTYPGSGVGLWRATNNATGAVDVPVRIAGLTGQDLTLVFTNTTNREQAMPTISLTASNSSEIRNLTHAHGPFPGHPPHPEHQAFKP